MLIFSWRRVKNVMGSLNTDLRVCRLGRKRKSYQQKFRISKTTQKVSHGGKFVLRKNNFQTRTGTRRAATLPLLQGLRLYCLARLKRYKMLAWQITITIIVLVMKVRWKVVAGECNSILYLCNANYTSKRFCTMSTSTAIKKKSYSNRVIEEFDNR